MEFKTVLISAVILIVFAVPGFFLRKFKVFDDKSVKVLVALLIFIAQPAMIGESILKQKFNAKLGTNMLKSMGIYVFVVALVFLVASIIFRRRKKKSEYSLEEITSVSNNDSSLDNSAKVRFDASVDRISCSKKYGCDNSYNICSVGNAYVESGYTNIKSTSNAEENNRIYRFAAMFGNNGYFGLPLIALLFPGNTTMLLYASLCVILFNILTWTVGIYILTGDKKYMSFKKGLLLPVPIVAALTLPFFFMQSLTIPSSVLTVFGSFGAMTTPLSMLIMGTRLAEIPFKEIFADRRVYIVSVLRLLAAPALTFCVLKLFGITDSDLYNTLMIVSLVPSAVTTIVLSEKFLTNSYTAVKAVLLTTILCIITIPILCSLVLI